MVLRNRGLLIFTLGAFTTELGLPRVMAEDKNGASASAISKPTGPGSLEGLGDAFQPSLNTGMANYNVAMTLPPGTANHTPSLALSYNSGRGCEVAGMGWSIDVATIKRQTDEGQPRYFELPTPGERADRFMGAGGEELVPLENGAFLSRTEGAFTRYKRVGDGWEAHTKSGVRMVFGESAAARVTSPDGTKIYRWQLERQIDTHGNVIEYSYARLDPASRQVYLTDIRYGPGSPPWEHAYGVHLDYEGRPDRWNDYRAGFQISMTRRLLRVDVLLDEELIRRYALTYEADPNQSLLTTVTQLGADGVSALPTTTFAYSVFQLGDPSIPIDASGSVLGSVGEPGSVLDSARVEIIDLNADGLPDLLNTDAAHLAYLNQGVHPIGGGTSAVHWNGPVPVESEDGLAVKYGLPDAAVHLADMNGDGTADWVVTAVDGVDCFSNTGRVSWGSRRRATVDKHPPPAPYSAPDRSVLSSDLDFDKKMDIIKSEDGAYSIWLNKDDGSFSDRILTSGANNKGKFIHFATNGVQLADMNGDRLADVVEVSGGGLVFCPGMGFGQYDTCIEMPLPATDPALKGDQIQRSKLIDVNGDGLADLVVERFSGSDLRFWLHLPNDTFARSRYITGLPASPNSATRWADINGNGTIDLIYADSSLSKSKINSVDIGVLISGSEHYNALTSIDNGYGRRTAIFYRGTTNFFLEAKASGNPWKVTVPFPVGVVSRTTTTIGLDLDGYSDEGPLGDAYITDFVYRDAYYDPLKEQFRGFSFVKKISRGDERFGGSAAPTLVTRHLFHTGAPDGVDNDGNGKTDEFEDWNGREEDPLKGAELWRETTSTPDSAATDGEYADNGVVFERVRTEYEIFRICTATGGRMAERLGNGYRAADSFGRTVRFLATRKTTREVIERGLNPVSIETQFDYDSFGNQISEHKRGDIVDPSDDLWNLNQFVVDEADWILDRVAQTTIHESDNGKPGRVVSHLKNYYDGPALSGLPLGQIADRGRLHRVENLIGFGPTPPLTARTTIVGDPRRPFASLNSLRQEFDGYGNVVVKLDALAGLDAGGAPDGQGHERRITYDAQLQKFPTAEQILLGGGGDDLVYRAEYDARFGTVTKIADANGNLTRYTYDVHGRLREEFMPGDPAGSPSSRYDYQLGAPISRILTRREAHQDDSPSIQTVQFFDGLGRKLGMYEVGPSVMTSLTLFNTRGSARKVFQPFVGGPDFTVPPVDKQAFTHEYDATGRNVRTVSPSDNGGVLAVTRKEYGPLLVREFDGEDTRPGPHANTPRTTYTDGLDRLIEVRHLETLSPSDSGVFITRYRYALPHHLAEIEDAKGNIKFMRYDGLGRKIFMNDPDRGPMTYSHDDLGNLMETVDAKGQVIRFAYDGAGRLIAEDYLDDADPLSLHRTPDVRYHYDAPSFAHSSLVNTRGRLSWVEDLSGAEYRAYDPRGEISTVIKRIEQPDGSYRHYVTHTQSDSLRRVYQIIYPDGGVVRHTYNDRGLLDGIPGFVNSLEYSDAALRSRISFANGVVTELGYDPRLRNTSLRSNVKVNVLQDFRYLFDQSGNVAALQDARLLPPNDPRDQSATYEIDNSYRLIRAFGPALGESMFEYDRIGNMTVKRNFTDAQDNVGSMRSGGVAGTAGRIGRNPGDQPGVHALTSTITSENVETQLTYDANGNRISDATTIYDYDVKDRIVRTRNAATDVRYRYDFTGRRIIKRSDNRQTSYVNRLTEVRGETTTHYVFAGSVRCAARTGAGPIPARVTQRIPLVVGWNLVSLQVAAEAPAAADVFSPLAESLVAAFGHDGSQYTTFVSGGAGNTLQSIEPMRGIWLLMTAPAELLVDGSLSSTEVGIPAGRAVLIGPPGFADAAVMDLLSGSTAGVFFHQYAGDAFGWRTFADGANTVVSDLATLSPGRGYWAISTNQRALRAAAPTPGATSFYHQDHLGSTHLITNSDAGVIQEEAYYPYGSLRHRHSVGEPSGYLFGGKERDKESGLSLFESRYYDSHTARFLTVDPLFGESPKQEDDDDSDSMDYLNDPINLNVYAFTNDNPVSRLDPTGTQTVYLINKARTEITVRTNIVIYGPTANKAMAGEMQKLISDRWNQGLKYDGKTVKFDVKVSYESRATALGRRVVNPGSPDMVYIGKDGRSFVGGPWKQAPTVLSLVGTNGRYSEFYSSWKAGGSPDQELQRVAAHEYGHIIGLPDQYRDVVGADGKSSSVVDTGWEGNLMSTTSGKVEQKNIDMALKDKSLTEE